MIEILPEQSTHEQLLNRVRSLARELAEAKAALAASESRENDLINRINELDDVCAEWGRLL
jgi:cell division protein FtsB